MKILGIDLGATAVKVVAIEATFRAHAIRGYRTEAVAPFEPPAEGEEPKTYADRARPALEALGRDGGLTADKIVCSLPAAMVAAHTVTLPFSDRKQVDATLPGEVENLIPFDPADIVFDSHQLSRVPGKTELFVAVAQRTQIQAVLELLKSVGADPQVVTFSALSLANLLVENYVEAAPATLEDAAPVEAIIDIGAERSNILIVEKGEAKYARSVAQGGKAVTDALARAVEVPSSAAEQMKQSVDLAGGGEPTFTTVAERSVSALVRDIRATFTAFATRTKRKITRVRVTGGGSHLGGFAGFLSDSLGLPVEPLALRAGVDFPDAAQLNQGVLALALALRGLDNKQGPKLNFRRGALAYAEDMGETRTLYAKIAAMAALVLVLFAVSVWAKLRALETREAKLDAVLCDVTTKILGKCETDYRVALGKLQGSGTPTASIPQVSSVDLVTTISDLFPQGDDNTLDDLDISDGEIRLRGTAKTYEAVDDLAGGLQKNSCFQDVKKGKLEKNAAGTVDFSLDVTYGCAGVPKESI